MKNIIELNIEIDTKNKKVYFGEVNASGVENNYENIDELIENIKNYIEDYHKQEIQDKQENDLIYSELGEFTLGSHNITRFNNVDEAFNFLIDEDYKKEELIEMLSERAKREVIYQFADVVVEEDGKFYFGNDFYFFEEEINKKTRIIGRILEEFNIKGIKPYDVIELLEQDEVESIDENLKNNINKAIKESGYEQDINSFIKDLYKELYKAEYEEEEVL